MKKNVVIFGIGSAYKRVEKYVLYKYKVLAYTSNNPDDSNRIKGKYINPNEINSLKYDYILICSSFWKEISEQLIKKLGIDKDKIMSMYRNDTEEPLNLTNKNMSQEEISEDIDNYIKLNKRKGFEIDEKFIHICDKDKYAQACTLDKHYFLQDLYVAKEIYNHKPLLHYDIGSRVDGFVSHLLAFNQRTVLIDIRPLNIKIDNLSFICSDATKLENIESNSIESLSSLHAIEHFGLGRYGDKVDPEACFTALKSFQRVLKKGGKLYLSVPVGPCDKLCFNSCRIFNPMTIINELNDMRIIKFKYIEDYTIIDVDVNNIENTISNIQQYSCGIFELVKK